MRSITWLISCWVVFSDIFTIMGWFSLYVVSLKQKPRSPDRGFCFSDTTYKENQPMIVNMSEKTTQQEINHVIERIREAGYQPHVTRGTERTIVAAVGSGRRHEIEALQVAPGVDNVVAIAQPFKLVSRQVKPERSVVKINGVAIGGPDVVV